MGGVKTKVKTLLGIKLNLVVVKFKGSVKTVSYQARFYRLCEIRFSLYVRQCQLKLC